MQLSRVRAASPGGIVMKQSELRNVHTWIRNTAVSEIVFVSALVLPAYLVLWDFATARIYPELKAAGLIVASVLYISGVIWMKLSQSKAEKDRRDLTAIINNIIDQGYTYMSFEKIEKVNEEYTKDRVCELIFNYPDSIRRAKLKGGTPGIKVLRAQEQATGSAEAAAV